MNDTEILDHLEAKFFYKEGDGIVWTIKEDYILKGDNLRDVVMKDKENNW